MLQEGIHDLRNLVGEIVAAHFVRLSAQGLVLDTSLPAAPVWVSLGGRPLRATITDLLADAVHDAGRSGQLRLRVEVDGTFARVVVSHGQHVGDPSYSAKERCVQVEIHPAPDTPVNIFASDIRAVAESIHARVADGANSISSVLNDSNTALLTADNYSRLVHVNAAAANLTGYSPDALEQLSVPDLLAMASVTTKGHWQEFAADGRQEGILVLLRKDGGRLPVRYCAIWNVRPGLHLSALATLER